MADDLVMLDCVAPAMAGDLILVRQYGADCYFE